MNNKMSLDDHINEKVRSAYVPLANMKVAFSYVDEEMTKIS